MHSRGSKRSGAKTNSERTSLPSMITISPGSSSRTNVAPITSRAGVSEASTQPSSNSSVASKRPRHSGRNPLGSRIPISRSASRRTKENAPLHLGQHACVRARHQIARRLRDSAGKVSAKSSATRSLSEATTPGSMPAASARVAVLVRLPLWARANPARPTPRYTGWAFRHDAESPPSSTGCGRYARCPRRPDSFRSSNTVVTRPMSFITVMASPSLTAIPADSWPRCCRAYRPSKVRVGD